MTKYALEIEQLNKTYRNGVKALKDINLNVEDGDLFAFLGPNGAGKSTVIGIITTLVNITSGTVKRYMEKTFVNFLKQQKNDWSCPTRV